MNPFRLRLFKTLTLPSNERISNQKEILLEIMIEMSSQGKEIEISLPKQIFEYE